RAEGEREDHQECGRELRDEQLPAHGNGQEALVDRPMGVFGGDENGADQDRDHRRQPCKREDRPLRRELAKAGPIVGADVDREDEHEKGDQPHPEREQQSRRAGLEELRTERAHSDASEVSSRNASSSEPLSTTSSCTGMPASAARSPTVSGGAWTASRPSPVASASIPASRSRARRSSARAERTRVAPAARAISSATGCWATTFPRWMIKPSPASCDHSPTTSLETKTLPPPSA